MNCNPVGKIVRKLTPEARTVDEKPFTRYEISCFSSYFKTKFIFSQLFSVPAGYISGKFFASPYNVLMKSACKVDAFLEKHMPLWFRAMFRVVIVYGKKAR